MEEALADTRAQLPQQPQEAGRSGSARRAPREARGWGVGTTTLLLLPSFRRSAPFLLLARCGNALDMQRGGGPRSYSDSPLGGLHDFNTVR